MKLDRNMTLGEVANICEKQTFCVDCQLFDDEHCVRYRNPQQWDFREEKEVVIPLDKLAELLDDITIDDLDFEEPEEPLTIINYGTININI